MRNLDTQKLALKARETLSLEIAHRLDGCGIKSITTTASSGRFMRWSNEADELILRDLFNTLVMGATDSTSSSDD